MNIKHLKSFVIVAKNGSISKAAALTNYSLSAVHDHLKALENELNVKLYERTTYGILLTEKGRQFLPYAESILNTYDEAMEEFDVTKQSLRLSASETGDFLIMKSLINRYIKKYPNVDVEYTKSTTDISIEKLTLERCDLSVICEPSFTTSKAKCSYLCDLPLVFVASPKHPSVIHGLKAARPFNTLFSTMALPVIDDLLKTAGLCYSDFFSATRNIGDLYTIKDLACSGQGIAILPETLVGEDLDSGKLKRIPELNHYFASKIFILTPLSHTAISAPVRNFIDLAYEFLNPKKISQKEKSKK